MVKQLLEKAFCLLMLGWLVSVPAAFAEMLISPTRAAMDTSNPSAVLILRNTSDGARTYRLSWEDKRINANGDYEMIEDGEAWPSAAEMVRFSPRQITVGPQENQTVRLSFRPPSGLAPGEYRSHLRLQVIAEESEPSGVMELSDTGQDGIGIKLFMQMSFSIPVIVRHEVSMPEVSISKVDVVRATGNGNMALAITLDREGDSSSFGNLVVEMQTNSASPVELIGRRKDVYVFHETSSKVVNVPLRDKTIPAGSWIRVAYEGIAEYEGKLWDERVFQSK